LRDKKWQFQEKKCPKAEKIREGHMTGSHRLIWLTVRSAVNPRKVIASARSAVTITAEKLFL